jgi:hypothetical protein
MAEREQAEREKKKNSPYCGGSSSSSRRCGASFICSDEVAVAGSAVYVLGGSVVVLQEGSELLEELAKLADGRGVGFALLPGGICKTIRNGPNCFSTVAWDTWRQRIRFV